jgi:hypothetical protein
MFNLVNALILALALATAEAKAEAAGSERYKIAARFEFDQRPRDPGGALVGLSAPKTLSYVGDAIDLTRDGKALIYLGDGIRRFDLDTGDDVAIADRRSLDSAGLGVQGGVLRTTGDPRHFIYVNETWKCGGEAFLIILEPVTVKRLTDQVCFAPSRSPEGDLIAMISGNSGADEGGAAEWLQIFDTMNGRPLLRGDCAGMVVDFWWESENEVRVKQRVYPKVDAHRQEERVYPVVRTSDRWVWAEPLRAGGIYVRDVEVESPKSAEKEPIIRFTNGVLREPLSLRSSDVFGPVPEEYIASAPRPFRAGDRIVILRDLVTRTWAGNNPAGHRVQVTVVRLIQPQ